MIQTRSLEERETHDKRVIPYPVGVLSSMVMSGLVITLLEEADQGTITEEDRIMLREQLPDIPKPEPPTRWELTEQKLQWVEELNRPYLKERFV